MTTVDAMADEIMKGLTDYADLADTSMKKAVRKTAKSVKEIDCQVKCNTIREKNFEAPRRESEN